MAVTAQPIAFPEAEGFGKYTTGGRGGKVYIVSNLDDDGEGSLRAAVTAKHPRMVVFAVSGTIHLKSRLNISKNITIAGQTAPGDGICIADYPVSLVGDNIIIRYLRFRMGDRYQNTGKVAGSGSDDAMSISKRKNVMIDHCSFSWSTDEVLSAYGGDSTTLQWNIISEPLNYSYHFEEGDTDFEKHGYGGIWGGSNLSAHHNLFIHCNSRTPRFNGARLGSTDEFVDFRNNVIYNWGHNNVYGGEGGKYNIVNNYYKFGSSTNKNVLYRIVNPSVDKSGKHGQFYVAGNAVYKSSETTKNNRKGIYFDKKADSLSKEKAIVEQSFKVIEDVNQSAKKAYKLVLKDVGASYKRDTLDSRLINDVKKQTGSIIDVQGGFKHGTPYEESKIAWPFLASTNAKLDTDKDGMPDDWEIKKGLNPKSSNDHQLYTLNKDYTNLEVYINSLTK
ncbi:pectate lyase family protein [Pedobacter glucosidilyticus]|uniref:pectate lyase family protein n=1 Tax=Pedobacter glucosidilyticus TaxID=1122941 RepID=UPI0026EB37F5|nr:pectate lyase [Pedobacter glucosidilyticus]